MTNRAATVVTTFLIDINYLREKLIAHSDLPFPKFLAKGDRFNCRTESIGLDDRFMGCGNLVLDFHSVRPKKHHE